MEYFLGIDIGTTSVKVVAFDPSGNVLNSHVVPYAMHHPMPAYSEQDPVLIFDSVITSIQNSTRQLAERPSFISFSAAMHSFMAVDNNGIPLTPLIIWADNRAKDIAAGWHKRGEAAWYYERTGVPVHAMSPLLKLAWFRENDPELFQKAFKFIGIKEYILFRLTGQFAVDTSVASATGLLNRETLNWDEEILYRQLIDPTKLPEVVSTKSVYHVREDKSLPKDLQGICLVMGASDGALANLGTGATGTNLAVTIGTSGAARLIVNHSAVDKAMRTFCYHAKDQDFIIGGGSNNGAVVLQWLKEQLLETGESYDDLFNLASDVPPGSSGLIMLPYILGERAPLWNADARGVFFGITKQHGKAHFVRAAVEAVIFSMYSIAKILLEENAITAVYASGGIVKSELWLQVMADVFGLPVHVSGAKEASAYGAVILGAEALNIPCNFGNRIINSFYPSEVNFQVYRQSFKKFERLYTILEDEMSDNS